MFSCEKDIENQVWFFSQKCFFDDLGVVGHSLGKVCYETGYFLTSSSVWKTYSYIWTMRITEGFSYWALWQHWSPAIVFCPV